MRTNLKVLVFATLGVLITISLAWHSARSQAYDPGDASAPIVVSTDPRNGQGNVPTNAIVRITFSEAMDPSSLTTNTVLVVDMDDATVTGNISYNNRTVAFFPFQHFNEMDDYKIVVSSQARDANGNSLLSDFTSTFTTGSE